MDELKARVAPFAKKIGVEFNDLTYLVQAFTHRSYINEHKDFPLHHNERVEFLGDAVLELVVSDYLFRQYMERPEGELTSIRAALVNTVSIAEAAEKLGANEYLLLSKGEAKDTGRARQYILANTYESIVGAIYLDQDYDRAKEFIADTILIKAKKVVDEKLWIDAKSYFQEKAQDHTGITPDYKTLSEVGPDHAKTFTVGVYLKKEKVAEGTGKSKQEAETEAARAGLVAKDWQ